MEAVFILNIQIKDILLVALAHLDGGLNLTLPFIEKWKAP
jgi:hypothetical protein